MGFNPAAIMAEMAIGGAVGQNMVSMLNTAMPGANQQVQPTATTPPPIPISSYNVAVNGQATGPFDIYTLQQMAQQGQFGKNSLVWKAGMPQWVKAETVEELNALFENIMPPIPPDNE